MASKVDIIRTTISKTTKINEAIKMEKKLIEASWLAGIDVYGPRRSFVSSVVVSVSSVHRNPPDNPAGIISTVSKITAHGIFWPPEPLAHSGVVPDAA